MDKANVRLSVIKISRETWIVLHFHKTGILKQVKDCIRECGHCQSKQERVRGSPEDATKQAPIRRKTAAQVSEEEDDDAHDELDDEQPAVVDKHELVIVSTLCPHLFH